MSHVFMYQRNKFIHAIVVVTSLSVSLLQKISAATEICQYGKFPTILLSRGAAHHAPLSVCWSVNGHSAVV
jgi:hypothetical protein